MIAVSKPTQKLHSIEMHYSKLWAPIVMLACLAFRRLVFK